MALAAPGLCWFDSGELALAAGSLGVAHPPGQPAYLVLAALAALLPVGDLSFRLTVLSAVSLAVSVGLIAAITARIAAWYLPASRAARLAPLLAGGLLALAPAAVTQAARPELYALSLSLLLGAVAALVLLRARGPALAALALCVAGAVHYALLLAVLPGLAVLAWRAGPVGLRRGVVASLMLLVPGLLQYLWLPLRSFRSPALDFGHPQTAERLFWAVTAGPYRRSFELADGQLGANALGHLDLALQSLGPLALVLAVLGGALVVRRSLSLALAGALMLGVGVLPTLLQGVFTADNPDLWGYLLMPLAVLACAAGLGAAVLLQALHARLPWLPQLVAGSLCVAVLAGPAFSSVDQADHSQREAPARLANALLDGSPPRGVLVLSGDSWLYPAMYQRYWEGRRADLQVLPLLQLDEFSVAEFAASGSSVNASSRSELGQRMSAIPASVRQEHYLRLLSKVIKGRPLLVNEAFLPPELDLRKRADGLLYRIAAVGVGGAQQAPARDPGQQRRSHERLWEQVFAPLAASAGYSADDTAHGVLARRFVARAGFDLSRGRLGRVVEALDRGAALQPDHGAMVHLARYRLARNVEAMTTRQPLYVSETAPWLAAFARGDDRAAEQLLDVALASAEGSAALDLQVFRASARLLLGDLDGAERDLTEVLGLAPFHAGAALLRERLYSLGRQVDIAAPLTGPTSSLPGAGAEDG